jgi:hypothetical protein
MFLIIIGIFIGWVIPRPKQIGLIEEKLLGSIKNRIPEKYRWW